MNDIPFQTLLQNLFLERLISQRKVSSHTVNSYRNTFRIYFEFLTEWYSINLSSIEIEHLEHDYIIVFCHYLVKKRFNKAVTINNRLATLKAFLKYVLEQNPEYSDTIVLPS